MRDDLEPGMWMAIHAGRPTVNVLIGVGVACDFSAGLEKHAPRGTQMRGLERMKE